MADPTNVLAVDDLKRRRPARDRADDRDRARGHRRAQRRALGGAQHERGAQAGRGRSGAGDVEVQAAEAGGDRSRSARDRQRRRAGHQDREPDPRAGDQGKGVGHSHRAVPDARSNCVTASTANWSQAESPPKALQLAITSRIKILAGLNIAERRVPQDGRFRIKVMGKEVDLRISILPTVVRRERSSSVFSTKSALAGSIDTDGHGRGHARHVSRRRSTRRTG